MEQEFTAILTEPSRTDDGHNGEGDGDGDEKKQQPLSAVAREAYDRYGLLDPIKLDLMIRGIFISREEAAALPHKIITDHSPDHRITKTPHCRPSRSHAALPARATPAPRAYPVARPARNDVSAVPSDYEKWTENEIMLVIKLRAEAVGFRLIANRLPGRNQKSVQEKFYKSIKDRRDPRWKRLYIDLLARNDDAKTCKNDIKILVETPATRLA
ncbi:hypothetical protein Daus18300_011976 [Diaporthe australafricana]|uniref:Myb-like domain-containing protein n=1 Tax=Diaporthe australafricana TaxID=127596 RepID=A0ABR3W4I0_9PEZI